MTAGIAQKSRADRKLSEVTKHLVIPEGIVSTGFGQVEDDCHDFGIAFDEWQRGLGKIVLGKTADGIYAATVGGNGISIMRQVGKTFEVGAIDFALSRRHPDLTTIWTSHHMATTGETFLFMEGFANRPGVAPYIKAIYRGSGDEAIHFTNGSRILFGAREHGFGRGFGLNGGVDVIICDEAQILTGKAMDNMIATMNTAPNPLMIFMGTPPRPEYSSDAFTRMRDECINGLVTDTAWIEIGAPDGSNADDRDAWLANPSYPHRTPLTAMMRLRRKLSRDSFLREGLGIWDPDDSGNRIDLTRWSTACLDRGAPMPSRIVLVVAVSRDRKWACLGIAGAYGSKTLVLCLSLRGMAGVVAKVAELRSVRSIAEVCLITSGQARGLQAEFTAAGIKFEKLSETEVSSSCVAFMGAVKAATVVHVGQGELDTSAAKARTRKLGKSETWDEPEGSGDNSPIEACAAAFYRWGFQPQSGGIY